MKKTLIILTFSATTLFAGFEYSTTSISGGLALLPTGAAYPGPFVSLETNTNIFEYFSLGLHIDYTWFAIKEKGEGSEGIHFVGIGAVPRGYLKINADVRAFAEFDPGLILAIAYFPTEEGLTDFDFLARYGQTYGIGINIKQFVFGLKIKQIFIYERISGIWFNIYAGYTGM